MRRIARFAVASIWTVVLTALAAAAVWTVSDSWGDWRVATCMPDNCFCEAVRPGRIKQPVNALSSLSFAFVGVLILTTGYLDRQSQRQRTSAIEGLSGYAIVYAVALVVVGFGSAFYHASLSFVGQFVDVLGMYLIATFVILYSFGRIKSLSLRSIVASYFAANMSLAWILFSFPSFRRYIFATILLAGLGTEYVARRRVPRHLDGRVLTTAVAALAAGFAIWVLDITRMLCVPEGPLQGHAIWHLAGAFASWQLYAYYRSERPTAS
jgi:hypothetical protein